MKAVADLRRGAEDEATKAVVVVFGMVRIRKDVKNACTIPTILMVSLQWLVA
jgi:hypothetical protein